MTGGTRRPIAGGLALAALAAVVLSWPDRLTAEWVFPGASWDIKTPEELGMNRASLDAFKNRVGGSGVVIKDGHLVYSWGAYTQGHDWFSASKPVVSTMLFFAINEGKVANVDSRIADWGWALKPNDQTMTFRHLADMTSGYMRSENPGQRWAYNDYAINLYIRTMAKVFGASGTDLSSPGSSRLATPLQFQDGGVFNSAGRVIASARDFARIGWFWMNKGNWSGTQLLPSSFFDNYVKADVSSAIGRTTGTDPNGDYLNVGSYGGGSDQTSIGPGVYGFNWWFNKNKDRPTLTWPAAPVDTFQANGRWGTEAVTMIPSLGMVVAAYNEGGGWGSFNTGDANSGMNQSLKLLVEAVPEPVSLTTLAFGGLSVFTRRRSRTLVE